MTRPLDSRLTRGFRRLPRGARHVALGLIATIVLSGQAWAGAGPSEDGDDLRSKTQNPVGNLISVPFENNFDFGAKNGEAYILNIQPVIPFRVGSVNFINRIIAPIIDLPGFIPGQPSNPNPIPGDGATGLGDINYTLFLSPAEPGALIWGIGPSIGLPTATDEQLGSEKWSAGPSVVLLAQPKPFSVGILLRQMWSFAGEEQRQDVNQTVIQPFVNFNMSGGWFLFSDPTITSNNKAKSGNKWTVPLGGGAGRLFNIGKQPINMRLGAFGNVEKPNGAPDWALKFTVQLLFPK